MSLTGTTIDPTGTPTIEAALAHARQHLVMALGVPVADAALDAEVLLAAQLNKSRSWLYTWGDKPLEATDVVPFNEMIERRAQGVPVAYLIGYREFFGLTLKVSNATLIPRADSECLVEKALALATSPQGRALDLGTGTGAIALAFASHRPAWQITATDRIEGAVALAAENAAALGLSNVRCIQSDWFSADALAGQRFDLILSNPPYIDGQDHHLDEGDVRFEPRSALVAEDEGYADLLTIIQQSIHFVRPGGWLLLEHGYTQGARVQQLLRQYGYAVVDTLRDLGGNERVTFGRSNPVEGVEAEMKTTGTLL
ncbi:Release factor glutamine methyltransferase [Halomonadaceae bacterium LMG 33818]|uniref:peptide chain release factor N(5)-glutamine methyltransferase n=1 Tax=Cernens ardua TaxID=3402176 RepID=UPI003EDBFDA6